MATKRATTRTTRTTSLTNRKRVKFSFKAGKNSKVFVAGEFNSWSDSKNKLTFRDGVHTTSMLLPRGKYEYKFVVDGAWTADPECAEWVPNNLGSLNSVLVVK